MRLLIIFLFFFFQAEAGIRYGHVTGVQTCALPILPAWPAAPTDSCVAPPRRRRGPGPARVVSSAGQSAWFTPRRSGVRAPHDPPQRPSALPLTAACQNAPPPLGAAHQRVRK